MEMLVCCADTLVQTETYITIKWFAIKVSTNVVVQMAAQRHFTNII